MAHKKEEVIETAKKTQETIETTPASTSSKRYKTEKCRVLSYNKITKELDIDFRGCGIRIKDADNVKSDFVSVKYSGEIGRSDFSCKL